MSQLGESVSPAFYLGVNSRSAENCRCVVTLVTHRSKSGIVNVYGPDASSWSKSDRPKPLKAIGNLTTSISAVRFNHDSQLFAIASKAQKDQMCLVWLVLRYCAIENALCSLLL
jgi:hypothetical protein